MNHSITNSGINILSTLNAMFPSLLYGWLDLYITSDNQGGQKKRSIYCSGLVSFTVEKVTT